MYVLTKFLELMTWNSGLTRCIAAHKVGENHVRVLQVFCKTKGSSGCPGNASSDDQVRIGERV